MSEFTNLRPFSLSLFIQGELHKLALEDLTVDFVRQASSRRLRDAHGIALIGINIPYIMTMPFRLPFHNDKIVLGLIIFERLRK